MEKDPKTSSTPPGEKSEKETALDDVRDAAREIRASQEYFESNLTKKLINTENFEREESSYGFAWRRLIDNEERAYEALANAEEVSDAEEGLVLHILHDDPKNKNTIEAQAANFYNRRKRALYQAIVDSDSDVREKDLESIRLFEEAVVKHIDEKTKGTMAASSEEALQRDAERTKIHDDAIIGLNNLNNLARKYGTRPFTPRNFVTSKNRLIRNGRKVESSYLRAQYDRDIVEEYYAIAFKDWGEEAKKRLEAEIRGY